MEHGYSAEQGFGRRSDARMCFPRIVKELTSLGRDLPESSADEDLCFICIRAEAGSVTAIVIAVQILLIVSPGLEEIFRAFLFEYVFIPPPLPGAGVSRLKKRRIPPWLRNS